MKILVTGGAGFIGSHVVEALQDQHEVVVVDDFNDYYSPTYKEANISSVRATHVYRIDVTDRKALATVFAEHQFDCIIHLAARAGVRPSIANPELYAFVNITGTTNVLELAVQHNVPRIIFGSTSAVYGNSAEVPFTETDTCLQPISPYAASKRSAELILDAYHRMHGIQTTILRFFTVYGERGRPDMAPYLFTDAILRGMPIRKFGDGTTSRDYTYSKDIVNGVVAAVNTPFDFEIINLGNHQPVSLNEFIATVEQATGNKAVIEQADMQPGDVERTYANIDKAKQLLDWQPTTSLADGMEKFVDWFKVNRL